MTAKLPLTIKKTTARLAAIQALYADEIRDQDRNVSNLAIDLITCYEENNLLFDSIDSNDENPELVELDQKFLIKLVTQVIESKSDIDQKISEYLTQDWHIDKLTDLLKSILRAGVCEIMYFKEVPPKVIINEYTTITTGFFSPSETGFVNSILDKIALDVRDNLI